MRELSRWIWAVIEEVAQPGEVCVVEYFSEWMGYMPVGVYQWVEVNGQTVSDRFSIDWSLADLDALVSAGFLRQTARVENPDDPFDITIRYVADSSRLAASRMLELHRVTHRH